MAATLLLSFPISSSAVEHKSLVWKWTEQEVMVAPGVSEVTVSFPYSNTGKENVRLEVIRTSCQCTVANSEIQEAAPEEEKTLEVSFDVQGRSGRVPNWIEIASSDTEEVVRLTLLVDIAPAVEITPSTLVWKTEAEADGDPPARTAEFRVHESIEEITEVSIVSVSSFLSAELNAEDHSTTGSVIIQVAPQTPRGRTGEVLLQIKTMEGKNHFASVICLTR